jgi:PAT family beta-lactamase induction signal transducer AmpG
MGVGIVATLLAAEPRRAEQVIAAKEKELPLWTPAGFYDAVAGPFVIFFRTYGPLAIAMLAAIALYRMPDFVRGPMVNPFFHDIGMSKDMIGLSRATFGLGSILAGVAAGGFCSLRFGLVRSLLLGGLLQGLGIAANALLIVTKTAFVPFVAVMMLDDFSLSFAAICLVTYMSSLTSLGYTATQYALLSSAYALTGKLFKGFSGLLVDGLAAHLGRMDAYALFFVICGLMGLPSVALFAWLAPKTAKKPGV